MERDNNLMSPMTFEEAVQHMRNQAEMADMVKACYYDEDSLVAAERFAASEEFADIKKILRLGGLGPQQKVLDVGCGNGIASYAFASLGHNVSAIDPDTSDDIGLGAVARVAAAVKTGTISLHQAYAEALPFPEATFDVVYTRQAVHHYSDLQKGMAECARVLKPGGLFFATREHVVNDEQQLSRFLEEHMLHHLYGGENAFSLNAYCTAIEQAGLKMKRCYASYDTVINHFPKTNAEIIDGATEAVARKVGNAMAPLLIKVLPIEKSWRKRLSQNDNHPGRMYSFLCVKPEIAQT